MIALLPEWRMILRKSWSVKFHILAASLGMVGGVLTQVTPEQMPIHISPFWFFSLAGVINALGTPVRLLAQKEITDAVDATSQGK